jgi:two-component system OmpR family response regulator
MHILIVDDDRTTVVVVGKALTEQGHTFDPAFDATAALKRASHQKYDLFILDRMLPIRDGLSLFQDLRRLQPRTPAVFLTAKGSVRDRIEGLDAGADDYVVKPFALGELIARVNAVTRLAKPKSIVLNWDVDTLYFEVLTRLATRSGRKLHLRARELKILEVLYRYLGQSVSKSTLLREIWGLEFDPGTSVVQTNISRLREKIDLPGEKPLIHTVKGSGYMLSD